MRVDFSRHDGLPERVVAEAELVFEDGEPLAGLKLVGFTIWTDPAGETYVTLPSRAFGTGTHRRYFDYVRSATETHADTNRLKRLILDAWRARG